MPEKSDSALTIHRLLGENTTQDQKVKVDEGVTLNHHRNINAFLFDDENYLTLTMT